jgi:hypothetical protein
MPAGVSQDLRAADIHGIVVIVEAPRRIVRTLIIELPIMLDSLG